MLTAVDFARGPSRSENQHQYISVDERQRQGHSQVKYQAWAPPTFENRLIYDKPVAGNSNDNSAGGCKKYLTTKFFMSLFAGFIICGIPLAVVSALYAQKKALSNSSSGSSSSATNLPSQCSSYLINNDATRLPSFTSCTGCSQDMTPYFTTGWYRFVDPAGTRLATFPPNSGACGASYPAWYNGTLPFTPGSTMSSFICVQYSGILCHPSYITSISITNCDGFYIFYLAPFTTGNMRFCTSF